MTSSSNPVTTSQETTTSTTSNPLKVEVPLLALFGKGLFGFIAFDYQGNQNEQNKEPGQNTSVTATTTQEKAYT